MDLKYLNKLKWPILRFGKHFCKDYFHIKSSLPTTKYPIATMKNFLFPICIAFSLLACGGSESTAPAKEAVVAPLKMDNYQVREIPGTDLQKAIRFDGAERVVEEGTLRNGKRHGTWVVYHDEKQTPFTVSNYVDDQLCGVHQEYNGLGQLTLTAGYINNVLDGRFARYKNGRLQELGFYKNGQYDGLYKRFYEGRNVLQQEANYKDGKLHGVSKFYSEKGDILMEYEYQDGEKVRGDIVKAEAGQAGQ
jgi:hypothetical protein